MLTCFVCGTKTDARFPITSGGWTEYLCRVAAESFFGGPLGPGKRPRGGPGHIRHYCPDEDATAVEMTDPCKAEHAGGD